ncbi:MAG TPA: cobalt-precorrin-5B (C(1))-methyltransferase CbiD [Dissulfurispiraceae bacterium]|nr:cobalt-precorrin-5B (C(1))-methyltransferase CbiD [Dissulfurispiraceae bacterium]
MVIRAQRLRSGFTTGACAAAAAKAAILCLDGHTCGEGSVEIPFPDGRRREILVESCSTSLHEGLPLARAVVIKDAGDDPDVTNGARIVATVSITPVSLPLTGKDIDRAANSSLMPVVLRNPYTLVLKGGEGVGTITKPGLAVAVGEAAINPVPRAMILEAATEALRSGRQVPDNATITITLSVTNGSKLAKKTLNYRLGIVGGISILGTTGIVTPLSADAWKAAISVGMDVAKATGCAEIVLSAGRSSEKAHMRRFSLPEEAYIMMGDHLEFSVLEAAERGFGQIHVAAQWAKMLKIAMSTPQTHVRFGALNVRRAAAFLHELFIPLPQGHSFNTAREMFEVIFASHSDPAPFFSKVCEAACFYIASVAKGVPVSVHLAGYEGDMLQTVQSK